MFRKRFNISVLVFVLLVVQSFCIYLPEINEKKSYDTIKLPINKLKQQQQHEQHLQHHEQLKQHYYQPWQHQQMLQQEQPYKQNNNHQHNHFKNNQQQLQQQGNYDDIHNMNRLTEMINEIRSQKQRESSIKQQGDQHHRQLQQQQQQQQPKQKQQEEHLQRELHDSQNKNKHQHQNQHRHQQFEESHEREAMKEKSYDKTNDVLAYHHDVSVGFAALNTSTTTTTANAETELSIAEGKSRYKRQLSDLFIVPHTKWCGKGNLANGTYNYLGGASLADKCCRRHDNCSVFIPSFSNRYEMFNYLPYTLSHCSCDRRFHTCLKIANDEDARTVGKLFFNIIQTNCFIIRNEKSCSQRGPDGECVVETVKQRAYLKSNRKF